MTDQFEKKKLWIKMPAISALAARMKRITRMFRSVPVLLGSSVTIASLPEIHRLMPYVQKSPFAGPHGTEEMAPGSSNE
jgi:hypothetical protein